MLNASTAEAGRQGATSPVHEVGLAGRRWDFDLGGIEVPVGIWQGTLDRTGSVEVAGYLADAVPNAQLTVHDDVGHLSLPVEYAEEILAFLVDR